MQDVFSRIFALLNRRIPLHFEDIMPSTQTGRQRILDEVTHLAGAFARLKLVDASAATSALEQTFRRRYVRICMYSLDTLVASPMCHALLLHCLHETASNTSLIICTSN